MTLATIPQVSARAPLGLRKPELPRWSKAGLQPTVMKRGGTMPSAPGIGVMRDAQVGLPASTTGVAGAGLALSRQEIRRRAREVLRTAASKSDCGCTKTAGGCECAGLPQPSGAAKRGLGSQPRAEASKVALSGERHEALSMLGLRAMGETLPSPAQQRSLAGSARRPDSMMRPRAQLTLALLQRLRAQILSAQNGSAPSGFAVAMARDASSAIAVSRRMTPGITSGSRYPLTSSNLSLRTATSARADAPAVAGRTSGTPIPSQRLAHAAPVALAGDVSRLRTGLSELRAVVGAELPVIDGTPTAGARGTEQAELDSGLLNLRVAARRRFTAGTLTRPGGLTSSGSIQTRDTERLARSTFLQAVIELAVTRSHATAEEIFLLAANRLTTLALTLPDEFSDRDLFHAVIAVARCHANPSADPRDILLEAKEALFGLWVCPKTVEQIFADLQALRAEQKRAYEASGYDRHVELELLELIVQGSKGFQRRFAERLPPEMLEFLRNEIAEAGAFYRDALAKGVAELVHLTVRRIIFEIAQEALRRRRQIDKLPWPPKTPDEALLATIISVASGSNTYRAELVLALALHRLGRGSNENVAFIRQALECDEFGQNCQNEEGTITEGGGLIDCIFAGGEQRKKACENVEETLADIWEAIEGFFLTTLGATNSSQNRTGAIVPTPGVPQANSGISISAYASV